jgi:hypothetical protein
LPKTFKGKRSTDSRLHSEALQISPWPADYEFSHTTYLEAASVEDGEETVPANAVKSFHFSSTFARGFYCIIH